MMGQHGLSVHWVCFSLMLKKKLVVKQQKLKLSIAMHKNGENGNRAQCV